MSETLITLPIGLIDEPRFVLRPVLRQSKEYLELRSSIEKFGLLTAVLVRPKGERYELVGGNWRRTVCVDLKRPDMPCIVREMTDEVMLALQLQENAVRFNTKPVEYANQLKRLMEQSPGMTKSKLAGLICKHPNWIAELLNLTKLDKELQLLIDRGEMPLMNAMMLAKLPAHIRIEQIDNACQMPVAEFKPMAGGILKKFKECVKQGQTDARYLTEFKPVAHARKPKEVEAETKNPQVLPLLIVSEGCKSMLDACLLGARWAVHLDRESVQRLREKAEREGRPEKGGDDGVGE